MGSATARLSSTRGKSAPPRAGDSAPWWAAPEPRPPAGAPRGAHERVRVGPGAALLVVGAAGGDETKRKSSYFMVTQKETTGKCER